MSEQKDAEKTPQEILGDAKLALAEAKAEFRKFKKANKIRKIESVTDKEIITQYEFLQKVVEELAAAKDELLTVAKASKGTRGGGGTYSYGKIIDLESQIERELTTAEKKKWRAHARKEAAKTEGVTGAEIVFDPDWFKPRVKKEKPEKVKASTDVNPEEAASSKVPRKKRVRKEA